MAPEQSRDPVKAGGGPLSGHPQGRTSNLPNKVASPSRALVPAQSGAHLCRARGQARRAAARRSVCTFLFRTFWASRYEAFPRPFLRCAAPPGAGPGGTGHDAIFPLLRAPGLCGRGRGLALPRYALAGSARPQSSEPGARKPHWRTVRRRWGVQPSRRDAEGPPHCTGAETEARRGRAWHDRPSGTWSPGQRGVITSPSMFSSVKWTTAPTKSWAVGRNRGGKA
ncbi:uncharacterized protein [Gorilla gorilla gorilla]|uniref:uncharacterized protein n=1 Tax=Gorilla gorilla gorilla TaxID=9595 RepID=UPI003008C4A1